MAAGSASVVILPSCLFHGRNTQREQDLLNVPAPFCSANPVSENLFQLRTKQGMGVATGFQSRKVAIAVAALKSEVHKLGPRFWPSPTQQGTVKGRLDRGSGKADAQQS